MAGTLEVLRPDFEQAMGETFSTFVCPPVPFEDASAQECCEVIWSVVGRTVTPSDLAALTGTQMITLSEQFGEYFGSQSSSIVQIQAAIAHTLARWPVGSVGE